MRILRLELGQKLPQSVVGLYGRKYRRTSQLECRRPLRQQSGARTTTHEASPPNKRTKEDDKDPKEDAESDHLDLPELSLSSSSHRSIHERHQRPREDNHSAERVSRATISLGFRTQETADDGDSHESYDPSSLIHSARAPRKVSSAHLSLSSSSPLLSSFHSDHRSGRTYLLDPVSKEPLMHLLKRGASLDPHIRRDLSKPKPRSAPSPLRPP